MAEKHERSGSAAEDASQFQALGTWPNINLKMFDDAGNEDDFGYPFVAADGETGSSASPGNAAEGKKTWVLRIHTDIHLDEKTFGKVHSELRRRNTPGRKRAHDILVASGVVAEREIIAPFEYRKRRFVEPPA